MIVGELETETNKHLEFEAPALLHKWLVIKSKRLTLESGAQSYLVFEGTLDQCIKELCNKLHPHVHSTKLKPRN